MWWGDPDAPALALPPLALDSEHKRQFMTPEQIEEQRREGERRNKEHSERWRREMESIDWVAGRRHLRDTLDLVLSSLKRDFDCTLEEVPVDIIGRRRWSHRAEHIERVVMVSPLADSAGSLIAIYLDDGAFILGFGSLHEEMYGVLPTPTPDEQVRQLQRDVEAYTAGRFSEVIDSDWVSYDFGDRGGGNPYKPSSDEVVPRTLEWAAWPTKTARTE
jgi:hypothetical protein